MSSNKQKSKPITTSVPSFAIRFHASGEELEDIYPSEEEEKSEKSDKTEEKGTEKATAAEINKHESSPMRDYLNKFGKRSSSIDTGINETTSINPQPSDPWRIFSEFKGKLTKTVEEKLSEIKSSKNSDATADPNSSPKKLKKENSDSEEPSISECSIPKSNSLNSPDEIMSSDDENSLTENDKTPTELKDFPETPPPPPRKRHALRMKSKPIVQFTPSRDFDEESVIKITTLTPVSGTRLEEVEEEVESGIEAYEEDVPRVVQDHNVDDPDAVVLNAPNGYVDMRRPRGGEYGSILRFNQYWAVILVFLSILIIIPVPVFLWGFILGIILATSACLLYYYLILKTSVDNTTTVLLNNNQYFNNSHVQTSRNLEMPILEVPAAKEYQPVTKFEGWINEYPEPYDPTTYHIARTQSVFLKLEGSILRISHTRSKIPKRAMWNEAKHKVVFTQHRMYNLQGSQVMLLPAGLIHKRLWSKKYPICIILNKEKMSLNLHINKKDEVEGDEDKKPMEDGSNIKQNDTYADPMMEQMDDTVDQATTDEDKDVFSESFSDTAFLEEDRDEASSINAEDWDTLALDETNTETKIYLFGRTCRDKEDWHRRLVAASHDDSNETEEQTEETQTPEPEITPPGENTSENPLQTSEISTNSSKIPQQLDNEQDYLRYMAQFNQVKAPHSHGSRPNSSSSSRRHKFFRKKKDSTQSDDEEKDSDIEAPNSNLWVNALIARVLYDVYDHDAIITKLQDLFQRKLSTIKLPYFIEDIVISDLSLGKSSPVIHKISSPFMDERGLWFYMDLTYEGLIRMALVTKLNLMKLKQRAGKGEESPGGCMNLAPESRSPMFHSDVEDSAESSSDEENTWMLASNSENSQDSPTAKSKTGGRNYLRMIDKIASSKYFQHATDIKYIKRAMEGVSKTEFKLNVEIQFLEGTLALNIPPPPSDRIWLGFRNNPKLQLSALPKYGERSLNFMHVTRWIEKKLSLEFQKFLVLPNMEDFVLPIMNPILPH